MAKYFLIYPNSGKVSTLFQIVQNIYHSSMVTKQS